jgi:phosphoserine phosphatase
VKKFKAIIFDGSGVLLDDLPAVRRANRDAYIWILSASPLPIVKALSKTLGVENFIGLEVYSKNGIYTDKCKRIMTLNKKEV